MSIAPQRPVVVEPQSAGAAGDGARGGPASVSGQAAEPSSGAAPGASLESASGTPQTQPLKAEVKDFSFYYGTFQAVKNVSLTIAANAVTALIGPSGCGKTTLLRCFNRMHDLYPGNRYEGQILLHTGESGGGGGGGGVGGVINVVDRKISPIEMRMRISMVFQKPNPFPKSIYENVAYGLRLRGVRSGSELDGRVEWALRGSALWDEVKDRLKKPGFDLSGGQQQRLCIARALAVDPEIVLFDEPTSALDPIATSKIEELIHELKHRVTIVIVTHNMSQAARVSDSTAFMYLGKLIEFDRTVKIFQNPGNPLTEQYVTGRFG